MAPKSLPVVPGVDDMLAAINAARARIDADDTLRQELTEGRPSGNPITLGPRLPSAEDWAKLQVQGAQNNAAKWLQNTTHPKKNFKEEALKASSQARYHDSMQKVLAQKTWEGGMELVNESEAMAIIAKRGSGVYSAGVADRSAKVERVVKELHSDRLALAVTIDAMPASTDAERETKMIANKRGNQAIGLKRRGG